VLQHLRKRLPLAQFFKVINDKPIASQLFEGWAKIHDRELLKDFYYQDDRKSASAGILIEESGEQTVILPLLLDHQLIQTLAARIDKLQLAKKIYSESKEFTFEAKVHEIIRFSPSDNRHWMMQFDYSSYKNHMIKNFNHVHHI
jgi:hypothetical protein